MQVVHATITSNGQVTIPIPVRDRLHLEPGDKIGFVVDEHGDLRVTLVTASVTRRKGMVPRPEYPASLEEMDEAIARGATRKR